MNVGGIMATLEDKDIARIEKLLLDAGSEILEMLALIKEIKANK